MCGISGIFSNNHNIEETLKKFNYTLQHRGPNASSYYLDENHNFGMGHTRLSILDLSINGNQPMMSDNKEWVLSYNGEIYNHLDIRIKISKKLGNSKINWKSTSDTETLLKSIEVFGFENTLEMLEGMFAIAIYNLKKNELYLARDRMGEKPLYFYKGYQKFIFGSEISIFKNINNLKLNLKIQSISEFLKLGYIKSPNTIYEDVFKLEPGTFLKISKNFNIIEKKKYWDLKNIISNNEISRHNLLGDLQNEKELLKQILEKTVLKQTLSDVQIGTFLSGGIDSALITGILSKYSKKKIKTFTVGFANKNYDESNQAKKISDHLNTEHYTYNISSNDLIETAYKLNQIYSEPFADSSQIPTFLISKLMKKEATVILSGDGGDELFGGYNRYIYLKKIKFISKYLPKYMIKYLHKLIEIFPSHIIDNLFLYAGTKNFTYKFKKLLNLVNSKTNDEVFEKMKSINLEASKILKVSFVDDKSYLNNDIINFKNLEEQFMYEDQIDYLPNDILCKVDRATMHNSIESRSPFLDHEVIEHSWKIPLNLKISNNTGKVILREILNDYVPSKLLSNSKTGFSLPIGELMKTTLKPFIEDSILLASKNQNFINTNELKNLWEIHKSGKNNLGEKLWPIIVFINWSEKNIR